MNFADVRGQYPQYSDFSDDQLGQALHAKFYADMPYSDFASKVGLGQDKKAAPVQTMDERRAQLATGAQFKIGPFNTGIDLPQGATEFLAGMGRRVADIGTLGTNKHETSGPTLSTLITGKQKPKTADEALDASGYASAGSAGADLASMLGGGMALRTAAALPTVARTVPRVASALGTAGEALMAPKSVKQAAAAGAAWGGATTPGDFVDRAEAAALQGGLGGMGQGAVQLLGRVISPKGNEAANMLRQYGVKDLTPGMALGSAANRAEQKATSLPVAGGNIAAARERAIEQFNVAAVNKALEPIGVTVGADVKAGRDLINHVDGVFNDAYGQVVPDLAVRRRGLSPLLADARDMAAEGGKLDQLNTILGNKLFRRFDDLGNLSGKQLKTAESELKAQARNYLTSPDADQRSLGKALMESRDVLMEHAAKTSAPEKIAQLAKVDEAYKNFLRVQTAATSKGAREGVFSPSQLDTAVRNMSGGVRKSQYAKGNAAMQDFSTAAEKAMGPNFPNSGTADRAGLIGLLATTAMNPALGAKMMAALLGGAAAYSAPGQKAIAAAMRPRSSPALLGAGRVLEQSAPVAGLLGGASAPWLINSMQQ